MAFPPFTDSWPSVPLPPPAPPLTPDIYLCHPFYGQRLLTRPCIDAASRLPEGDHAVPYNVQVNSPLWIDTQIDGEDLYGDCSVMVQSPGVEDAVADPPPIPDVFRVMASWIISECVDKNGWGGFATVSLQNMIDWVASAGTHITAIDRGEWPASAQFYTVTVTSQKDRMDNLPFLKDPIIATAIGDGVRQKGNNGLADMLAGNANEMTRGPDSHAWNYLFDSDSSFCSDDEMVYSCNANLGAPSPADCIQLAYSGLGPLSDSVTIGPGSGTKFLSLNSCNVGITTLASTTLTWAQIQAALNALIDNCVTHPLLASRGGKAYAKAPLTSRVHRRRPGTGKRDCAPVNGLNALPPGVNITLLEQEFPAAKDTTVELKTCSWMQAIKDSGNVNLCPPGT